MYDVKNKRGREESSALDSSAEVATTSSCRFAQSESTTKEYTPKLPARRPLVVHSIPPERVRPDRVQDFAAPAKNPSDAGFQGAKLLFRDGLTHETISPKSSDIPLDVKPRPFSTPHSTCAASRYAYSLGSTIPFCAWYLPFRSALQRKSRNRPITQSLNLRWLAPAGLRDRCSR
jgi:hypothetical protein